ncbi:MAG: hypothetical protein N2487_02845 [Verrucomicrobiae bacterium]|nr:hypothetical protein [Verrucomicrobiae bacterium]
MKLTTEKKQYLALIGLGTAGVIAALYFTIMSSQFERIAALDKQIGEAAANVDKAKKAISRSNVIVEELEQLTNVLSDVETNNMAPPGDMYSWFVDNLRKFLIPYQNQISIPFRSREVIGDVGMFSSFPYKSATFSVRGEGSFHQFGRFLADLENKFQYFRVQRIVLTPVISEAIDTQQKLQFEMDIVTLVKTNGL